MQGLEPLAITKLLTWAPLGDPPRRPSVHPCSECVKKPASVSLGRQEYLASPPCQELPEQNQIAPILMIRRFWSCRLAHPLKRVVSSSQHPGPPGTSQMRQTCQVPVPLTASRWHQPPALSLETHVPSGSIQDHVSPIFMLFLGGFPAYSSPVWGVGSLAGALSSGRWRLPSQRGHAW